MTASGHRRGARRSPQATADIQRVIARRQPEIAKKIHRGGPATDMEFIDAREVLDRDILGGFADLMERRPHRVEQAAIGVVVGNLGFAPHPCRLSGIRRLYL